MKIRKKSAQSVFLILPHGKLLVLAMLCFFSKKLPAQEVVAKFSAAAVETGDTFQLRVIVSDLPDEPGHVDFTPWASFFSEKNILARTGWKRNSAVWGQNFTLIAFDSAQLALPPLPVFLKTGQKIHSTPLQLSVRPTPASSEISDLASLRDIRREPTKWFDFWPYALAGLVLLLLVFWFARRKPKAALQPVVAPAPPPISPSELALKKLQWIENQKLALPEFCVELSLLLRSYLENRYQFPALESTTREILRFLKKTDFPKNQTNEVLELLEKTDLAKFAERLPETDFQKNALRKTEKLIRNSA